MEDICIDESDVVCVVEIQENDCIYGEGNTEENEMGVLVDFYYGNQSEQDNLMVPGNNSTPLIDLYSNPVLAIQEPVPGPSTSWVTSSHAYAGSAISESQASDQDDDDEEAEARRINGLTQSYISGKLTFAEFVKRYEILEDNEEDEDYESCPVKKVRSRKAKVEDDAEEFDFPRRSLRNRKGRGHGPRRVRCALPPVMSNLLGEAHLKYAQNEKTLAAQICEEIIRQVPQAAGPYKLLGMINQEEGKTALAHHYFLIAAHLSPENTEDWVQLAEISLELNERDQALTCLSQAIKSDRYNPDLRLRQIKLLQNIGETKAAMRAREQMVKILCGVPEVTQRHGLLILLQAKIAAREFHQENNLLRAALLMETAVTACKSSAKPDDINLLVELHCERNENTRGLAILQRECGVVLGPNEPPYNYCSCPQTMAPDLRAKLIVFLVRLDISSDILLQLLQELLQGNPDEQGDLFLDIVEALMAKNRHNEAMVLLNPLVKSESFSMPAVWLTHGECLRNLGEWESSINSYYQVMTLAPQHVQGRLTLSSMLCQIGRFDEALAVLRSDNPEPRLLYEEFFLSAQADGNKEHLVDVAISLLTQYVYVNRLKVGYKLFVTERKIALQTEKVVENGPTEKELYDTVVKACDVCLNLKLFEKMKRIAFLSLYNKQLIKKRTELRFLCLIAAIHAKDMRLAWALIREFLYQFRRYPSIWNLLGLVLFHSAESPDTKFIIRLISKDPFLWPANLCYANYAFSSGNYKEAMLDYVTRHRAVPHAYTALLIAISFTHTACQKYTADKQKAAMQAQAFFEEYRKLRGPHFVQEINYNVGRAMHQLGLFDLAVCYYKKVLEHQLSPGTPKMLDLTRETAFNLALIYKKSGSRLLAMKVIQDYIVI